MRVHCTHKRKIKLFVPDEVRKIRSYFHKTRDEFADLFYLTSETVKGWELGRRNISGPAIRVLQDLEDEMIMQIEADEKNHKIGRAKINLTK